MRFDVEPGADCVRARRLLASLDADPAAGVGAARADVPGVAVAAALDDAQADAEWLARHMESCPSCSGGADRLTTEIVAALGRPGAFGELPNDDFFAARHAEIMAAVRAEPATAGAGRTALSGRAAARRPATVDRDASHVRGDAGRRVPRPSARRMTWGVALAASVAVVVALAGLGPRLASLRGSGSSEGSAVSIDAGEQVAGRAASGPETGAEVAADARTEALALADQELLGGDDAWLVASTDPSALHADLALETLSDEELDELAAALAAERG